MVIADTFKTFPQLKTQRLILRQIVPEDVDAIFALYSDDVVAQYLDIDTFTEHQEAVELVQFFIDRYLS